MPAKNRLLRGQVAQVQRRIRLNVSIDQVPHVGFVRLDVEFLARVPFDGRAGVAVKRNLLLHRGGLRVRIARLGQVLGNGGKGPRESCHRLVERHP